MKLTPIPEVLSALRAGKPVLVADDEGRENEGDAILAAEHASTESLAWMIRNTSGFLCAPMTAERAKKLNLPPMVQRNEDSLRTAYTVTVDSSSGITTGISAHDRAVTLRALANPKSTPSSVIRPGHIVPVIAAPGGVRERPGHTEATVELLTLAGLNPVGVIGEMVLDTGEMMRLPELIALGQREGLAVTTIAALSEWLNSREKESEKRTELFSRNQENNIRSDQSKKETGKVRFDVETTVPTIHGSYRFRAYHDTATGADHLAIVSGNPPKNEVLVRVHSECLTGEAFGSLKCECGPQLDSALEKIAENGGIVIYLRGHEGRGIGLTNKLRAYRLQEKGLDTLDANLELNLPGDARDYSAAAAILAALGISSVRLLTNNPDKVNQLLDYGISVSEQVPLIVGIDAQNTRYLNTKRNRMGHLLPEQTEGEAR